MSGNQTKIISQFLRKESSETLSVTENTSPASSFVLPKTGKSVPADKRRRDHPRFYISNAMMDDFRTAFDLFDADCTGFINENHLRVAIRTLGFEPSKEEIRLRMATINKDGTGRIAFKDFIQIMTAKMTEQDTKSDMLKSFKLLDEVDLGHITIDRLKVIARELGENLNDEELREMIYHGDYSGDGKVTQQDFMFITSLITLNK